MSRTPFVDLKIRSELCGQLQAYFKNHKSLKKSKLARDLGISRAALYTYVKGTSTPSPELLARLLELPEISLTLAGRRISPAELRAVKQSTGPPARQYSLPFDVPVYVEEEARRIFPHLI